METRRYYRIHPGDRPVETLLRPGRKSRPWTGEMFRTCEECRGSGQVCTGETDGDYHYDRCERCRGLGDYEYAPVGVSVCRDVSDLIAYFRERHPMLDGDVLVEIEGVESDDEDHDHGSAGSPVLIIPTRIVSVQPLPDDIRAAIEE